MSRQGGRFLPGQSGNPAGRPKGSRNGVTATVKDAFLESLQQLGGVDYLVKLGKDHPEIYARLLLQILPKPLPESDDEDNREAIPKEIRIIVVKPDGTASEEISARGTPHPLQA